MESLSMGVPVVAWRVGGIPEMAPDGNGVVLVDAGDVAGLEAAIVRLMEQPETRRNLAESGFRFAQRHFSSEAAGTSYASLFRGLIGSKPAGAPAEGLLAGVWKFLGGH
jgi:glycosyltransferase involved in cell wall biosynthesis